VKIYLEGTPDLKAALFSAKFIDSTRSQSDAFQILNDANGNEDFGYYYIFPQYTPIDRQYSDLVAGYTCATVNASSKTLLLTITYEYTSQAAGLYSIENITANTKIARLTDELGPPLTVVPGHVSVGGACIHVDDDAANDPYPHESDDQHTENGSVDYPYDAIQQAITAASDGDIIIVKDGTYSGSGNYDISFEGKAIMLASENGPSNCIVDAEAEAGVFVFENQETPSSVLKGFTITGGAARAPFHGGGILCSGASPLIIDNVVTGNTAGSDGPDSAGRGGGIYSDSDAVIMRNIIHSNEAYYGGGLYLETFGGACTQNQVSSNSARYGGGMHLSYVQTSIVSNTITENEAAMGAGGYVIATGALRGNTISNNVASATGAFSYGGGLYLQQSACTVDSNMIWKNEADIGGAVYLYDNSCPKMTNDTLVHNLSKAPFPGGVACDPDSSAEIRNCILWNNGTEFSGTVVSKYSCYRGATQASGNVPDFPYFVDEEHDDYHIRSYSPCLNKGDSRSLGVGDIDRDRRVLLGCVDIGADEATSSSPDIDSDGLPDDWETDEFGNLNQTATSDYDGDGMTDLQEYKQGSLPTTPDSTVYVDDDAENDPGPCDPSVSDPSEDGTIQHPFDSVQEAVTAAYFNIFVAGGDYQEEVQICGGSLHIQGGWNSTFTQNDPSTYVSTVTPIGAPTSLTNRALTCVGMTGDITGFSLTGGDADVGGAISLRDCSVSILNNSITDNRAVLGGGIHGCGNGTLTIAENTITSCTANDGGAVFMDGASLTVGSNVIGGIGSGNSASRDGGALKCKDCGVVAISANTITFNTSGSLGGAISCYKCTSVEVLGNAIADNAARSAGGALAIERCSSCTIANNVIAGNQAPAGGGVQCIDCAAVLTNNTIADNTADNP